jgi:DNA primase
LIRVWIARRLLLDYRRNAAECRTIARLISLRDERERLLRMAEEWDHLAEEREARLRQRCSAQPNDTRRSTG